MLACDGIWDVMSNQQVVDFVGEGLGYTPYGGPVGGINATAAAKVCDDLLAECLDKGSHDNMTVILLIPSPPPSAPSPTEESMGQMMAQKNNNTSVVPLGSHRTRSPRLSHSQNMLAEKIQQALQSEAMNSTTPGHTQDNTTGNSFMGGINNNISTSGTNSHNNSAHNISLIKNELDISQYQYNRHGGSNAIHSMHPPVFDSLSSEAPYSTDSSDAPLHHQQQQTPPKEKSKRRSVLHQMFAAVEEEEAVGEERDRSHRLEEGSFDDGIASPLNTAPGREYSSSITLSRPNNGDDRVRKQLQYEI